MTVPHPRARQAGLVREQTAEFVLDHPEAQAQAGAEDDPGARAALQGTVHPS